MMADWRYRSKIYALFLVVPMMVVLGFPFSCYGENYFEAYVERIVSGDTVILRGGTIVRYMGIDTPSERASLPLFRGVGSGALEYNKSLVEKKLVRLELVKPLGVSSDDSRKFAYVFVGGRMINALLLKKGLAFVSKDYPPADKYNAFFIRAQSEAALNNIGVWKVLNSLKQQTEGTDHAFK